MLIMDYGYHLPGILLGKKAGVTMFAIGTDGSPTFRGWRITGGSININNSWYVDTSGNMWWGNSSTYAGATYIWYPRRELLIYQDWQLENQCSIRLWLLLMQLVLFYYKALTILMLKVLQLVSVAAWKYHR